MTEWAAASLSNVLYYVKCPLGTKSAQIRTISLQMVYTENTHGQIKSEAQAEGIKTCGIAPRAVRKTSPI